VSAQRVKTVDVVGVGLNATDTVIQLPHFPAFNSKVEVISSRLMAGGQVASAMVACQRWGLRTRYVGKVGNDAAGEFQSSELAKAKVEAHLVRVRGCPSQCSFIIVDKSTGERTVLWQRDPRMELRPGELRREWIVSARALLVDGHDTAAAACAARWARAAKIPVTADLDNFYPGVEALLDNVDFLISSREFPARLTGEKDLLEALRSIHRRFENRLVGATLGTDGVIVWDGSEFHYCPAFRVETIDTTGAGDVFHAAFVYAQLAGWTIAEQLKFSCAAAALNCTAIGARGGIAPLGKIQKMMRDGPMYPRAFHDGRFMRKRVRE
jgi:sulfofructose kinase